MNLETWVWGLSVANLLAILMLSEYYDARVYKKDQEIALLKFQIETYKELVKDSYAL